MYAKITKDLLYDGKLIQNDRTNEVIFGALQPGEDLRVVRLLDDDRDVYYEAEATEDALEDLFEWAMKDSGVTILQTRKIDMSNGRLVWDDEIS
jgi:hypothetical protein